MYGDCTALYCESVSYCEYSELLSLRMELCYLAPLWQLYQKLLANVSPGYCDVPSIVRSLTELFYAAENLAIVSILMTSGMFVLCMYCVIGVGAESTLGGRGQDIFA